MTSHPRPPIRRIYEDNHLLVVVKPPGIPVQASSSDSLDLLSLLKDERQRLENKPGRAFVALVHRLDQPVGGLIVFAKTSKAASRLSEQIRSHLWTKYYLAIVVGQPSEDEATLRDFLWKDERSNTVFIASPHKPDAKEAILHYRTLASLPRSSLPASALSLCPPHTSALSLLLIRLETGRPHQIRVQLASRDHALLGDHRYGDPSSSIDIALWSRQIDLLHPTRGGIASFHAFPPPFPPWSWFPNTQQPLALEPLLPGSSILAAGDLE